MEFDILYFFNGLHTEILDSIMIFLTQLGDKGIIWIVLAIALLFHSETRICGIFILISLGLGLIIGNGIIKNLMARPRPYWIDESITLLIPGLSDYSFPSGHTLASFEAAIMIFMFDKKWGIPALILAILIGISRMYLFVHFPTDVLAGALLGTAISLIVYYFGNKIVNKFLEKQNV